jgi:hypothetical protein
VNKRIIPAAALIMLFFACDTSAFVIVRDGESLVVIVTSADAPGSIKLAARELADHIKLMSGAAPAIVSDTEYQGGPAIALGDTTIAREHKVDIAGLGVDGFRLVMPTSDVMVIRGRDYTGATLPGRWGKHAQLHETPDGQITRYGETGTLFGVYWLLRQMGVRWYAPGPDGTIFPNRSTLDYTGGDVDIAPKFPYRELSEGAWFFGRDPEAALFFKRCGFGAQAYLDLNHGFTNWTERFADRPELFETRGGKSLLDIGHKASHMSINFSNPAVLEQWLADARQWFTQPMSKYWRSAPKGIPDESRRYEFFGAFSAVPNDGMGDVEQATKQGLLQPARGPDGEMSEYIWGFTNKAAAALKKEFPRAKVINLAYYKYRLPPSGDIEPNIIVGYVSSLPRWSVQKQKMLGHLRQWAGKKPAGLYVFDNFSAHNFYEHLYGSCMIMPRTIHDFCRSTEGIIDGVAVNMRTAPHKNRNLTFENQPVEHLNVYMLGRCLWEGDLDLEKELEEYYRLYYGPAAGPVRAVVELIEKRWIHVMSAAERRIAQLPPGASYRNRSKVGSIQSMAELFPPEVLAQMFAHLRDARRLAVEEPYRKRVQDLENWLSEMRNRLRVMSSVPSYKAPAIAQLPNIDGRVDGEALQAITKPATAQEADEDGNVVISRVYGLSLVENAAGEPMEDAASFYLARSGDHLYIAARIGVKDPSQLMRQHTGHDSQVWEDDCIEVFMSNPQDPGVYCQIAVNSRAAVFDAMNGTGLEAASAWSSGVEAAALIGSAEWYVELAVPMEVIEPMMHNGAIRFNLMSTQRAGRDKPAYSAWSPTFGSFHTISRHGLLVLN